MFWFNCFILHFRVCFLSACCVWRSKVVFPLSSLCFWLHPVCSFTTTWRHIDLWRHRSAFGCKELLVFKTWTVLFLLSNMDVESCRPCCCVSPIVRPPPCPPLSILLHDLPTLRIPDFWLVETPWLWRHRRGAHSSADWGVVLRISFAAGPILARKEKKKKNTYIERNSRLVLLFWRHSPQLVI